MDVRTSRQMLQWVLFSRPIRKLVIVFCALIATCVGLCGPLFQRVLIDGLQKLGAPSSEVRTTSIQGLQTLYHWSSKDLLIGMFLSFLMVQAFSSLTRWLCSLEAAFLYESISKKLYIHAMDRNLRFDRKSSVGENVNVFAQDISATVAIMDEFFAVTVIAILPLVILPFFLVYVLEMPAAPSIWTMILLIGVMFLMSWRQSGFFTRFKKLAAARMSIVSEWIQNIRILKILGWIEFFEDRILVSRRQETKNRLGMVTNGSIMNSIAQISPWLICIVAVSTLLASKGGKMTPGELFALVWCFSVFVARPMRQTPWLLVVFWDGMTSMRRIVQKLGEPIESSVTASNNQHSDYSQSSSAVRLQGLSMVYEGVSVLEQVDLQVPMGQSVALVGDVGSGKSQLFQALQLFNQPVFTSYQLFGLDIHPDNYEEVRSHFLYVPQEPFILNATLRDNVVFKQFIEGTDEDVLAALKFAQFDAHEEGLSLGLLTPIGEKGVNLSGGQKQRVSIARAVYAAMKDSRRKIVLMDDSFSALDSGSEARIIESLFKGPWKDYTILLVTHRMSALKYCDRVLELRAGRLLERKST
jgi:ABC-type multidrug transport system fused ATPase/permease subunit